MEPVTGQFPSAAKWGYRVAVAAGCLTLLMVLFNPVFALLEAAVCFTVARGIHRGRAWAAIAAAGFWLIPIPVLLLRGMPASAQVSLAFSGTVGLVMAWAAAALWRRPAKGGAAWPWAAFLALFTVGIVCFRPFAQPSVSMAPTVLAGDRFFVETATWTLGRAPARDQIVAIHYPIDRKQVYIKRIAGVPGDRLTIRVGKLVRNGTPVAEPWAVHASGFEDPYRDNFPSAPSFGIKAPAEEMLRTCVRDGELVVPAGAYFVLGDNRDDSFDSRYWGLVRRADIIGSPVLLYGSYARPADGSQPPSAMPGVRQLRWNRLFRIL